MRWERVRKHTHTHTPHAPHLPTLFLPLPLSFLGRVQLGRPAHRRPVRPLRHRDPGPVRLHPGVPGPRPHRPGPHPGGPGPEGHRRRLGGQVRARRVGPGAVRPAGLHRGGRHPGPPGRQWGGPLPRQQGGEAGGGAGRCGAAVGGGEVMRKEMRGWVSDERVGGAACACECVRVNSFVVYVWY